MSCHVMSCHVRHIVSHVTCHVSHVTHKNPNKGICMYIFFWIRGLKLGGEGFVSEFYRSGPFHDSQTMDHFEPFQNFYFLNHPKFQYPGPY